jgi:hypothetical protein
LIENWKPVPGWEDRFAVSDWGRVRSLLSGRLMCVRRKSDGYLDISLRAAGRKAWRCTLHRLVAVTFLPADGARPYVNHKDGDRANNYVANLEWCTQSENMKHAVARGSVKVPSRSAWNYGSKLTEDDVRVIRAAAALGMPNHVLARGYGMSESGMHQIVSGANWKRAGKAA